MPITITMPALSPTMEEGNLAKWLVKEGDNVSAGDIIAEIETDKATMEVEAVDDGVVAKIIVEGGSEGVKVNSPIAILAEEGENPDDVALAAQNGLGSSEKPQSPAGNLDPADQKVTGSTQEPKLTSEATQAEANSSKPDGENRSERLFVSPLARRMAKDSNIDLTQVAGSGPKGRIVKADIERIIAQSGTATSTMSHTPSNPISSDNAEISGLYNPEETRLVPHDTMRKVIARRLVESKQTVPHFYLNMDCNLEKLLQMRKDINAAATLDDEGNPAYKVSVNDMIIKAMAMALQAVPDANVSWSSENMLVHKHSDVGVAVSIPGGLITPIVRKAEIKTLSAISIEMKDLAARARQRKLAPEEYQGGSTAVSNLGMFGIREFSAVINPPQATILAIGAGEKRPIVVDDAMQIATMMSATLSTDHRAVDGVLGAQLLGAFKERIENPVSMLV